MEKINIAEILKDCPKGMELDCTICNNVYFDEVTPHMIKCFTKDDVYNTIYFNHDGTYLTAQNAKCVIFPKGKTTWKGFQRPFKDGDILAYDINSTKSTIFIYRYDKPRWNTSYFVALSGYSGSLFTDATGALSSYNPTVRFATKEEKQKLFDAIKANGYKWNAETKTLEKLIVPKFKIGDRVKHISAYASGIIVKVDDKGYCIDYPKGEGVCYISFKLEDDYELVPNKFDITTLKPFESRVLVRTSNHKKWVAAFYSHYDKDSLLHHCVVGGLWYEQCIPYEGNEHLLDTTDECDKYFKTWK